MMHSQSTTNLVARMKCSQKNKKEMKKKKKSSLSILIPIQAPISSTQIYSSESMILSSIVNKQMCFLDSIIQPHRLKKWLSQYTNYKNKKLYLKAIVPGKRTFLFLLKYLINLTKWYLNRNSNTQTPSNKRGIFKSLLQSLMTGARHLKDRE